MRSEGQPFYTHPFGSMGPSLDTAIQTDFFQWFHLAETERHSERPGEIVRFRPSGDKFQRLCYLDVLVAPNRDLVRMELTVQRSFLDGPDALFAQDLVKSFLLAALPDACRNILHEFLEEIDLPSRGGETQGSHVFRGQQRSWRTQTGWTRLLLVNTPPPEASLLVQVEPNPEAPNSRLIQ
jgi:hypothetical protein